MAGLTSRLYLTLTIPSVFGFFSALWFLRRRRKIGPGQKGASVATKAVQVGQQQQPQPPPEVHPHMKLKDSGEGGSEMVQLKEAVQPASDGVGGTAATTTTKKSRESFVTCPKDSSIGSDKHLQQLEEDNGIELAYGIEDTDLDAKDDISRKGDMEDTNCGADGTVDVPDAPKRDGDGNSIGGTHELLTLPDGFAEIRGEMLESPGATYCDSVGSSDSGKGPSENQFETYHINPAVDVRVYEFDILQELVGLLIGRNGRHVRHIKELTNANILIKRHPYSCHKKICSVTGTDNEIHAALKMIRKRFPAETYPSVTLSQIPSMPFNVQPFVDISPLSIPNGVSFEAMLCATVNAGHFFLQQPTHPSFHSLPALTDKMKEVYSEDLSAPPLSHIDKGFICAAEIGGGWFRAEINEVFEETDECRLKFLDYGGYAVVPRSTLKQIRIDFMCVPFQATECYLGNVTVPDGETEWSAEATAAFEELAQGQIVQGYVVGYHEDKVPFVNLYKVTGASSIFINRELVSRGLAKWVASDIE